MQTSIETPEIKERKTIDRGQISLPVFGCFFYGSEAADVEREKKQVLVAGEEKIPVRVIDVFKIPLDFINEISEITWNIYDCSNKDFINALIQNNLNIIKTHELNIGKITGLDTRLKTEAFVRSIKFTYMLDSEYISLIIFEKLAA